MHDVACEFACAVRMRRNNSSANVLRQSWHSMWTLSWRQLVFVVIWIVRGLGNKLDPACHWGRGWSNILHTRTSCHLHYSGKTGGQNQWRQVHQSLWKRMNRILLRWNHVPELIMRERNEECIHPHVYYRDDRRRCSVVWQREIQNCTNGSYSWWLSVPWSI